MFGKSCWLGLAGITLSVSSPAATLVWTGGGGDDNFSTPENWNPVQAPAKGDSLTFAGEIAYGVRIANGRESSLASGVYGGPTCTVPGVRKVDWIDGTGTLRVRKTLNGGVLIVFR